MRRHTAALVCFLVCISPFASAQQRPFVLQEATIASIHSALASHQLTCVDLVRSYVKRIDAYDHKGPGLNTILTINPKLLETAAELDKSSALGSLFCIPVILKDNFGRHEDVSGLNSVGRCHVGEASAAGRRHYHR